MGKNLSNKYDQKLLDSAKKSTADAIKTASKREIQKTAEATKFLIKITSVHSDNEIEVPNIRYISPEERQQIMDGLRFV